LSGLSFFRPEFLWGALFTGVVFLIHFLRRPKVIKLEFSTLRFFKETAVKTSRLRQLRNILLLILRLLIVSLIAVLFARPYNRGNILSELNNPQSAKLVWIDPTASMEYTENGKSIGQTACNLVDTISSKHNVNSSCFKIFDYGTQNFQPVDNGKLSFKSRFGSPDLQSVFNKIKDYTSSRSLLLLFSDFQNGITSSLDSILERDSLSAPVICVSMTPDNPWNFYVCNTAMQNKLRGAVNGSIYTQGKQFAGKVELYIDKRRSGIKNIDVKKDDSCAISIDLNGASENIAGQVRLHADDPLTFDNVDYFSSKSREKFNVLIIGDQSENMPLTAVFKADAGKKWGSVQSVSENELQYDKLDSADLIVINGLKSPSNVLGSLFKNPQGNKTVIFSLSADSQNGMWGRELFSKIFPGFVSNTVQIKEGRPAVLSDTISGIWRGFPSLRCEESAVYSYCSEIPGDMLLRFGDGTMVASHTVDKSGNSWIISATPLGVTKENNLCETGFYVAFIDRIAELALSKINLHSKIWIAGVSEPNPFYGKPAPVSVYDMEGKFIRYLNQQSRIIFDSPGNYKIVPEGLPSYYVTVKPSRLESELKYSLPRIPDKLKKKIIIITYQQFLKSVNDKSSYIMWFGPWIVLLLFLLCESLLWENKKESNSRLAKS
jgi:hypothetical protein